MPQKTMAAVSLLFAFLVFVSTLMGGISGVSSRTDFNRAKSSSLGRLESVGNDFGEIMSGSMAFSKSDSARELHRKNSFGDLEADFHPNTPPRDTETLLSRHFSTSPEVPQKRFRSVPKQPNIHRPLSFRAETVQSESPFSMSKLRRVRGHVSPNKSSHFICGEEGPLLVCLVLHKRIPFPRVLVMYEIANQPMIGDWDLEKQLSACLRLQGNNEKKCYRLQPVSRERFNEIEDAVMNSKYPLVEQAQQRKANSIFSSHLVEKVQHSKAETTQKLEPYYKSFRDNKVYYAVEIGELVSLSLNADGQNWDYYEPPTADVNLLTRIADSFNNLDGLCTIDVDIIEVDTQVINPLMSYQFSAVLPPEVREVKNLLCDGQGQLSVCLVLSNMLSYPKIRVLFEQENTRKIGHLDANEAIKVCLSSPKGTTRLQRCFDMDALSLRSFEDWQKDIAENTSSKTEDRKEEGHSSLFKIQHYGSDAAPYIKSNRNMNRIYYATEIGQAKDMQISQTGKVSYNAPDSVDLQFIGHLAAAAEARGDGRWVFDIEIRLISELAKEPLAKGRFVFEP